MKTILRAALAAAFVVSACAAAKAEILAVAIMKRSDVLSGKSWGDVGPYQKLLGKVVFTLDPKLPANRLIPNIDKAPLDDHGLVEFEADIRIYKPVDQAKGNGVALFEIPNRGGNQLFTTFSRGKGSAGDEAEYGDGALFQAGYTLVWVGWQFSVPHTGELIGVQLPLALQNDKPLTGKVTSFGIGAPWIPAHDTPTISFDPDLARYTPVDLNERGATLTVAQGIYDRPRPIPRDQWQFAKLVDGKPVADPASLTMKDGFKAGLRYDLTYTTNVSPIGGLGYAAQRDVASAFKFGENMPVKVKYTYAFGSSQSGRFLREFIYRGFNADEQGRTSFDAIWAKTGAAARGDFIQPFSDPDGLGIFTGSQFPFANTPEKDPVTGKTDSMLMHMSAEAMPKIIYTNTETEYVGGGRAAALIHTSYDGKRDLPIPDNVRIYMWASAAHGAGSFPPQKGLSAQLANANDYNWAMRGTLKVLDDWVRKGIAPPDSRYPHLSDGSLIPHADLKFPAIPGVPSPAIIPSGYRADVGGPLSAPRIAYLNPQVDADGNDVGGVRLPEIAVPLATYTGWSFRAPENGAPTEIIPLTGMFIPFALTKAEREKTGDPRLSIEERYSGKEAYLAEVRTQAQKLADGRYILAEDIEPIVAHAGMVWDSLTAKKD